MQQKLATASDKEQVTKADGLDSMTDELEDSELETVSGGFMWWGKVPEVADRLAGKPLG
ncbi:hypothetical protein QM565_19935 [Geitlerinema splendidum]|nr:hypothetical protein [Geitlerinema splendidum]